MPAPRAIDPPSTPASRAQAARDARRWAYLAILVQEAGIDPKKVPAGQSTVSALLSPYERRGYTAADIESWVSACDPEVKPSWDEVECFRAKVRTALKPKPGLGTRVALAGGVAFLAAFLLTKRRS